MSGAAPELPAATDSRHPHPFPDERAEWERKLVESGADQDKVLAEGLVAEGRDAAVAGEKEKARPEVPGLGDSNIRHPHPSPDERAEWERMLGESGIGLGKIRAERLVAEGRGAAVAENNNKKAPPKVPGLDESDGGGAAAWRHDNPSLDDRARREAEFGGDEGGAGGGVDVRAVNIESGAASDGANSPQGRSTSQGDKDRSELFAEVVATEPASPGGEHRTGGASVATSGGPAPGANHVSGPGGASIADSGGSAPGAYHVSGPDGAQGQSWSSGRDFAETDAALDGDAAEAVPATLVGDGTSRRRRRRSSAIDRLRNLAVERLRNLAAAAPLVEGVALPEEGAAGGGGSDPAVPDASGWCKGMLRRRGRVALASVIIVAAAGALTAALAKRRAAATRRTPPPWPGSQSPSAFPSLDPTAAPTTVRFQALREVIVRQGISEEAVLSDDGPASPQRRALSWLADADGRGVSPEWDGVPAVVQRYILVVFYFSTDGDGWLDNDGFLSERHECDGWFGVYCYEDSEVVEKISIHGNNVVGTLPDEIGSLSIRVLNLGFNKIGGSIPDSLRGLGESIERINLRFNSLTGSIPEFFADLPKLTSFNVGVNILTGTLPETLNSLEDLAGLSAYSNLLSGTLGIRFDALPLLEWLDLFDNLLTGSIPDGVRGFANSTGLILGENDITGTIPEALTGLSRLKLLGLWDMRLNGTIPPGLFGMESLVAVSVGGNSLTGTVPEIRAGRSSGGGAGAGRSLRGVAFERNRLTGPIPSSMGNLPALEAIAAHSNYLTGAIPAAIGNNTSLRALELGNNGITGSVPDSFLQLVNLEWLSLAGNRLSGNVSFLCNLSIAVISADCGGNQPEIECMCCNSCCSDDEANCAFFLDTGPLIKNCFASNRQDELCPTYDDPVR